MSTLIIIVHILVCIFLMVVILMQAGKGGGLSSAFGGGGPGGMAGQMFGGRGAATFLSKVTSVLAAMYMVLVILMNLFPGDAGGPRSIIREEVQRTQQASPAQGLPTVPPADQPSGAPVTPTPDAGQEEATQPPP